ncbi:MAG: hypothetical protein A2Y67_04130 [Candidatus Buchananbacteria bacterium RBG_13_39_9]|uniref:Uncharacterized protein n=1 Tax=Candidatus Buchananbacteria bacterium RBG_13_39_9 TaxID=1797531 RepID=A0A1G1XPC2_9BACT|nr:MAG: hypothetical protein A2Y67_04130 [Candidatus Buchananbacteria bacterium RBG_13_39_9]
MTTSVGNKEKKLNPNLKVIIRIRGKKNDPPGYFAFYLTGRIIEKYKKDIIMPLYPDISLNPEGLQAEFWLVAPRKIARKIKAIKNESPLLEVVCEELKEIW